MRTRAAADAIGIALAAILVSACAAPGPAPDAAANRAPASVSRADDWMGADFEHRNDPAFVAMREARLHNNDDYFQVETGGRIYVFSDLGSYHQWLWTGEIPLVVTRIGDGPKGETLKLQLSKADAKAMEKRPGYKGAAQRMYEGELEGIRVGFYGEVVTDAAYYVFSDWHDLQSFRATRAAPCGVTAAGAAPGGKTAVFVQSCEAARSGRPSAAIARFKTDYGIYKVD